MLGALGVQRRILGAQLAHDAHHFLGEIIGHAACTGFGVVRRKQLRAILEFLDSSSEAANVGFGRGDLTLDLVEADVTHVLDFLH
jgi:hypothetical protein